jgi:hypothetical protein
MAEIVAQEVRAGRADALTELADEIAFFAVKTLADYRTAKEATRGSRAERDW